jgi:hypothetical protein
MVRPVSIEMVDMNPTVVIGSSGECVQMIETQYEFAVQVFVTVQ